MNFGYCLSGAAPRLKKYKVASTMIAGIPILNAASSAGGLATSTTASAVNAVGVTQDGATFSATPALGAEGIITVMINPDAVWDCLLSGGAGTGTALITTTNSATSTTVVTISTNPADPAPNSPTMDEGTVFCIYGTNFGQSRKITSVGGSSATAAVAFYNTSAVNDVFCLIPLPPIPDVAGNAVTLTTALTQLNMGTNATGAAMRLVELQLDYYGTRTSNTAYVSNTRAEMMLDDHVFNVTT